MNRLVHVEDCENLLFIPRINKALESAAGFPGIPAPVNVSPATEGQDPPTSGKSLSPAFVWSLAIQLSANKSKIYDILAVISCKAVFLQFCWEIPVSLINFI